ncbi:hypothetical protein BD410DRAFT_825240 [Rickenella mellea]|uniref:F-box domain-containing protein n=1 Tax=Rickenella mellea TaxID=50990 RepID=A0A4Y7QJQ8_9AGAM|nr:hypothetical protein BD410DRAFT_825240 [Rickenella mellea]
MTLSKRGTSPKMATTTSVPRSLKADVERDDIDAQIRALLTRRNALSNFCCLPTEVLAHIFSHIQRSERRWISETRVISHIPDLNQFLSPVTKSPMIRLQNLVVANNWSGVRLPLELHDGSNLKGLALERCLITWESENVFSLQRLSIKSLPEPAKPTMSQLLVILSTCSQLEELNLTNAGPTLVFAANVAICSKFLSRLRFPADIQWKITVSIKRGQEHITFTPPASTNCKLLFVDLHSSSLDISYGQRSSIFEPTGRRAKLRVTWNEVLPTPFWVDIVESAFTLADRKTTTDLHFRSNHSLTEHPSPTTVDLWHRFFCFLPNLRTLRFQNSYYLRSSDVEVSIAKVLGASNDRSISNGGMVCPNLRHAELSHFNLSAERGDALEELKTFLEFRKTNQARLSTLTLRNCNGLSRDKIAPLKRLVGSVDWDGVVREDWSETDEDETDESVDDEYYDEFYDHPFY